jgi:hypothetical protein
MISSAGIFFIRQAFIRYVLVGMIAVLGIWQLSCSTSQIPNARFLSQRFAEMKKQEIPGLFLNSIAKPFFFDQDPVPEKAFSVSKKIGPFLEIVSSQGKTPTVIVPGYDDRAARLVFFLNYLHPKVAFKTSLDVPFFFPQKCNEDFLYILFPDVRNAPSRSSFALKKPEKLLKARDLACAHTPCSMDVFFTETLKMRDLHDQIDAEQLRPMIRKHARALLDRARRGDATLSEIDFRKLNKALLEALYPEYLWKDPDLEDHEVCIGDYCWNNVTRVYSSEDGSTVLYRLQSSREFPAREGEGESKERAPLPRDMLKA